MLIKCTAYDGVRNCYGKKKLLYAETAKSFAVNLLISFGILKFGFHWDDNELKKPAAAEAAKQEHLTYSSSVVIMNAVNLISKLYISNGEQKKQKRFSLCIRVNSSKSGEWTVCARAIGIYNEQTAVRLERGRLKEQVKQNEAGSTTFVVVVHLTIYCRCDILHGENCRGV